MSAGCRRSSSRSVGWRKTWLLWALAWVKRRPRPHLSSSWSSWSCCPGGDRFRGQGLAVLGDSTAALQVAISLKSAKSLNTISREIAWRRVRHAWHYAVGHLPAELNVAADALSRVFANNVAEKKVRPRLCEGLRRVGA